MCGNDYALPLRADFIPLFGHIDHAAAQHLFHGPAARESGVWDVFPGSCALPQFLLAFSHRLLPLRESVSHLLEVSTHTFRCFSHTCVSEECFVPFDVFLYFRLALMFRVETVFFREEWCFSKF